MTQRFEFRKGASSKFWEISVSGASTTVRYGRIGSGGNIETKTFATPEAAEKNAQDRIQEKKRKGYQEVAASKAGPIEPTRTLKKTLSSEPNTRANPDLEKRVNDLLHRLESRPSLSGWAKMIRQLDWAKIEHQCAASLKNSFKSIGPTDDPLGGLACEWSNDYSNDYIGGEFAFWHGEKIEGQAAPSRGGTGSGAIGQLRNKADELLERQEEFALVTDLLMSLFARSLGRGAATACQSDEFRALNTCKTFQVVGYEHDGWGCNVRSGDLKGLVFVTAGFPKKADPSRIEQLDAYGLGTRSHARILWSNKAGKPIYWTLESNEGRLARSYTTYFGPAPHQGKKTVSRTWQSPSDCLHQINRVINQMLKKGYRDLPGVAQKRLAQMRPDDRKHELNCYKKGYKIDPRS